MFLNHPLKNKSYCKKRHISRKSPSPLLHSPSISEFLPFPSIATEFAIKPTPKPCQKKPLGKTA